MYKPGIENQDIVFIVPSTFEPSEDGEILMSQSIDEIYPQLIGDYKVSTEAAVTETKKQE